MCFVGVRWTGEMRNSVTFAYDGGPPGEAARKWGPHRAVARWGKDEPSLRLRANTCSPRLSGSREDVAEPQPFWEAEAKFDRRAGRVSGPYGGILRWEGIKRFGEFVT